MRNNCIPVSLIGNSDVVFYISAQPFFALVQSSLFTWPACPPATLNCFFLHNINVANFDALFTTYLSISPLVPPLPPNFYRGAISNVNKASGVWMGVGTTRMFFLGYPHVRPLIF